MIHLLLRVDCSFIFKYLYFNFKLSKFFNKLLMFTDSNFDKNLDSPFACMSLVFNQSHLQLAIPALYVRKRTGVEMTLEKVDIGLRTS